jgi:hypothetical protein
MYYASKWPVSKKTGVPTSDAQLTHTLSSQWTWNGLNQASIVVVYSKYSPAHRPQISNLPHPPNPKNSNTLATLSLKKNQKIIKGIKTNKIDSVKWKETFNLWMTWKSFGEINGIRWPKGFHESKRYIICVVQTWNNYNYVILHDSLAISYHLLLGNRNHSFNQSAKSRVRVVEQVYQKP